MSHRGKDAAPRASPPRIPALPGARKSGGMCKPKLTEQQALEALARHSRGETLTAIASSFGVEAKAIGRLVRGETWAWLERI